MLNSKGLLTRKLLDAAEDIHSKKNNSNDPAVRMAFASRLDSETRGIQDRQVRPIESKCTFLVVVCRHSLHDGLKPSPNSFLLLSLPQVIVQQFYECRVAALERYLGFCVMFHAMAESNRAPWLQVPWDIARSQSNLRVATTGKTD